MSLVIPSTAFVIHRRALGAGVALLALSLVVFLVAYYQILGESPDYNNYDQLLHAIRDDWRSVEAHRFEPGFLLLTLGLISVLASNAAAYSLMATGSVFLKAYVFHRVSKNGEIFAAVLFFYLVRFYSLHELTQIRVALAAAFLLIAAYFAWNDKRVAGLLVGLVAATFHVSALVVVPMLFLQSARQWPVLALSAVVFLGTYFMTGLIITGLEGRLSVVEMYLIAGFGDPPNPVASGLLLDWGMIAAGLLLWNRISSPMKNVLALQLLGMAIFYGAMDFPVIAHRIRELLAVFWVFFIAYGFQRDLPVKIACAVFVAANIVLYFYLYILSGQFFF